MIIREEEDSYENHLEGKDTQEGIDKELNASEGSVGADILDKEEKKDAGLEEEPHGQDDERRVQIEHPRERNEMKNHVTCPNFAKKQFYIIWGTLC